MNALTILFTAIFGSTAFAFVFALFTVRVMNLRYKRAKRKAFEEKNHDRWAYYI